MLATDFVATKLLRGFRILTFPPPPSFFGVKAMRCKLTQALIYISLTLFHNRGLGKDKKRPTIHMTPRICKLNVLLSTAGSFPHNLSVLLIASHVPSCQRLTVTTKNCLRWTDLFKPCSDDCYPVFNGSDGVWVADSQDGLSHTCGFI